MTRLLAVILLVIASLIVLAAENNEPPALAVLPALSRAWHGADYKIISAAIDKGTLALPSFATEQGTQLLKKLVSTENLELARNKTLPFEYRLQELLVIVDAAKHILMKYLVAANRADKVNAECAALLAFHLHLGAAMAQAIEDFLPTVPRDEKYPVRMEGLRQVQSGFTNMFLGAETSLSERSFYQPDDISLLLQAMADTLPMLKNRFAADFVQELHNKLEIHRKAAVRPTDIENLDRMLLATAP